MRCLTAFVVLVAFVALTPAWSRAQEAVKRGAYIFRASGGCSCHTDGKNQGAFMAGGRPIATPFGRVYATNITPDVQTGIGSWNDAMFIKAMTQGVSPQGAHYFPVFPYPSFTRITTQDLLDLKAYLFSLPAVSKKNSPLDLRFPFGWRQGVTVWKWLFFRPGPYQPRAKQSAEWNRGAYLVTAVAHCGECHTPRNFMGGPKKSMHYAGSLDGPEGELAPNITPDEATGIGAWSITDIVWFLQNGFKPDGDDTQGLMSELIDHGYQYLSPPDARAIAVYLKSLPPIANALPTTGE